MNEASQDIVVIITTKKIQSYIFTSNRLREHIGASYLIKQATTTWVDRVLASIAKQYQVNVFTITDLNDLNEQNDTIDYPASHAAMVISTGGGKVRLLMKARFATAFIKQYTRKMLEHAPGLPIYVGISSEFIFDPQGDNIQQYLSEAEHDISEAMRTTLQTQPLLGLGVTATCSSSGLPATHVLERPEVRSVANEIYAKSESALKTKDTNTHSAARPADEDMLNYLEIPNLGKPHDSEKEYRMPLDFDDFGRSEGDQSYLAIVHIDGNNLGERVRDYIREKSTNNAEYITRSRTFSRMVEKAVKKALKKVLAAAIPPGNGYTFQHGSKSFSIKQSNGYPMLPLRFLILGGDDITFICDGRLGLALATTCLHALQEQQLADEKIFYGCAGVSIVKTHYPFARAYDLAEELCASAKSLTRQQAGSALDWHIAASGLSGNLATIREREYSTQDGHLHIRPVLLDGGTPKHSYQDWQIVRDLTLTFAGISEHDEQTTEWAEKRNKVMQLRESLRKGPDGVQQFTTYYGRLPQPQPAPKNTEIVTKGWHTYKDNNKHNTVCVYFDPIELIDFYWPLVDQTGGMA